MMPAFFRFASVCLMTVAATGLCASNVAWSADEAAHGDAAHDSGRTMIGSPEPHAADGHDAHAEQEAIPGFTFKTDLALWSLITFLVFLFVLSKLAWKPLIAGLDQREARIRQDIADAETNRLKSEELLKSYDQKLAAVEHQVKEILAEARRDAETTRMQIVQTAQQEAEATRERAVGEINRAKDQALSELSGYLEGLVSEATSRVLSQSLSGPDHERLVREALTELGSRRN
jgi:F-type H+-transporting ATPase subunit b